MMKKLTSVLAMTLGLTGICSAAGSYGIPENIQDGNILHCFDWTMADVKAELPNIAAAGFGAPTYAPAARGMTCIAHTTWPSRLRAWARPRT